VELSTNQLERRVQIVITVVFEPGEWIHRGRSVQRVEVVRYENMWSDYCSMYVRPPLKNGGWSKRIQYTQSIGMQDLPLTAQRIVRNRFREIIHNLLNGS
jgi:hypothetical protein